MSGKEISISCSPVDTIAVVCGISRTAHEIGRAITEATLRPGQAGRRLADGKDQPWFRVVVIDNGGKRAWSNPDLVG